MSFIYDVKIDAKTAYNEIFYKFFSVETRWNIIFGGASSGKSVFMGQLVVESLLEERNWLCVRKYKNTLQGSIYNELHKAIKRYGLDEFFVLNRATNIITCTNGCQAVLCGLDDVEKIKSITPKNGVFTDIWVEEATEITEDDLNQLNKRLRGATEDKRLKKIFLTFNPIIRNHWIYRRFFTGKWDDAKRHYQDENITIQHVTYRDNKFLNPDDIQALEVEHDKLTYDVYTLGLWGTLGEGIFNNWEIDDLTEIKDQYVNIRNGIDFGFVHPAAFVRLDYNAALQEIRIFQEAGGHGMLNRALVKLVKPIVNDELVMCDSAEPKSITELRSAGLNVFPVKKAKGSMRGKITSDYTTYCIQWLSSLRKIVVDKNCRHTISNLQLYHWEVDRRTGETKPTPVKLYDDFFPDAVKYALNRDMLLMGREQPHGVIWI